MGRRPLAAAAATVLGVTGIAVGVARGPAGTQPRPMLDPAGAVTAGEGSVVPPGLDRTPTAAAATTPRPIVPPQRRRFHQPDRASTEPLEFEVAPAAVPPAQHLWAGDAEKLRRLATVLITADLTGIGRRAFPDLWGDDPQAHPCCETVTVHRAIPGRHPTREELAVVLVTWSGVQRSTGARIAATVTPVTFIREAGGWRPVPVQDLL